jgi:hypothetical protein
MTLDELKNYFRFQSTLTETYTPLDQYEYQTISKEGVKVVGFVKPENFAALLDMINAVGFIFEGYKDKAPIFIIPANPDTL